MNESLLAKLKSYDNGPVPLWIITILLVNATFILVTGAHQFLHGSRLYTLLSLGAENNPAAWWSSMLLLLVGVLYYDTAEKFPNLRIPLWTIGLLMVALSVDEQASLHERVFQDNWMLIIIVGLVGASVFLFAVLKLFNDLQWRRSAIIVTCGFACFSMVVVQEYFEHRLVFPEWATGIRTAVEESSELIGVFLCLFSIVRMRIPLLKSWQSSALVSAKPLSSLVPLAILGLILHGVASLVTASLTDLNTRGNPAMWFPTACFFLCAYVGIRRMVLAGSWTLPASLLQVSCVALSALHTLFILPWHSIMLLAALGVFVLLAIVKTSFARQVPADFLVKIGSPVLLGLCLLVFTQQQAAALFFVGITAFAALLIHSKE